MSLEPGKEEERVWQVLQWQEGRGEGGRNGILGASGCSPGEMEGDFHGRTLGGAWVEEGGTDTGEKSRLRRGRRGAPGSQ